jgi:hypothetical protein
VRDAFAAVFRQPEFATTARVSLWGRFLRWLRELLDRFGGRGGEHPIAAKIAVGLLIAVGVLVAARLIYAAMLAAERRGLGRRGGRARASRAGDPWAIARAEAAAGRWVEAAHALYQALLAGLAERERGRLHPSKTAGDYVRELSARRSPRLPRVRDFARAYEVVAYGTGRCDAARYERLLALAESTLATPAGERGAA